MTADNWHIPGGPVIAEDGTRLRLPAPEGWTRVVLDVWQVPPSMNTDKSRGWRSFYRLKREWQNEIETLLMVNKVQPGYQRAIAGCLMRFPTRKTKRDPSNFRAIVDKSLADALVAYRVIPDDDEPHYHFGGVEFDPAVGDPRTWIHVFLPSKES